MGNEDASEYELCTVDDMNENQAKEFEVKTADNTSYKIILTRYENEFFAVGNKCSHLGLSLANGVFYKGRLRCFAHGACFNVKTGDIEDFPGVDCLPSYTIKIHAKKVYLVASKAQLELKKRVPTIRHLSSAVSTSKSVDAKLLVVGMGAAGLQCIETLRQQGYGCEITLIGKEPYGPYDRTKISKSLDFAYDKLAWRDEDFFKKSNISLYKNQTIRKVNLNAKQLECDDGKTVFNFTKLVIATGLEPLKHKALDETNVNGVFTLRSLDDSNTIFKYFSEAKVSNELLKRQSSVLIIGSSFVALETAAYFSGKASVTVICHRKPFGNVFGDEVADRIVGLHESKGVKFLVEDKLEVVAFQASNESNKRLTSVKLSNGTELSVDLCLVAIGSRPATSFLAGTAVDLNANGYIIVDENMKTNVPDVFAVGDVTSFPRRCLQSPIDTDDHVSIGHWHMASSQGKCAAHAIMEDLKPLRCVPFVWTVHFGKSIRFAGFIDRHDQVVFHSDPDKKNSLKFAAFYLKSNVVVGMCTCDWDPLCATLAELMYNNVRIARERIEKNPLDLKNLMN
jgi:NADPH-dependent 2,4-dienoyl-CoA reductase/sulfur reductase-like enzyme/nitrite reductase/ring-hydroxylating ferredoxin subunit